MCVYMWGWRGWYLPKDLHPAAIEQDSIGSCYIRIKQRVACYLQIKIVHQVVMIRLSIHQVGMGCSAQAAFLKNVERSAQLLLDVFEGAARSDEGRKGGVMGRLGWRGW